MYILYIYVYMYIYYIYIYIYIYNIQSNTACQKNLFNKQTANSRAKLPDSKDMPDSKHRKPKFYHLHWRITKYFPI